MFFKYLFFFLFLISCSSTDIKKEQASISKKKTIPLNVIYKIALENFEKGNYADAEIQFKTVETDYSYSNWAAKAKLIRAYIFYDSGRYIESLTLLQNFKKRYPGSKEIDYVEYLIGICLFEQVNFISLSQENTNLALRQFQKVIDNFPNSSYASDAKYKIDLLNEQLSGKELYLARYYIKRKKWLPAIYRLDNIVKNYQSTIFIEEALHRLVEIHFNLGNVDAAKKYASILGYNYNQSDWYKKSYNLLEAKNIYLENSKQKTNLKEKIKKLIKLNN